MALDLCMQARVITSAGGPSRNCKMPAGKAQQPVQPGWDVKSMEEEAAAVLQVSGSKVTCMSELPSAGARLNDVQIPLI